MLLEPSGKRLGRSWSHLRGILGALGSVLPILRISQLFDAFRCFSTVLINFSAAEVQVEVHKAHMAVLWAQVEAHKAYAEAQKAHVEAQKAHVEVHKGQVEAHKAHVEVHRTLATHRNLADLSQVRYQDCLSSNTLD